MPRLLTVSDVLSRALPPVSWLVEPLIAEGERVLWYGESGSLKSWLLLSLGLHLAAGKPWLDFPITRPYRVLFVDEEMGWPGLWTRVWKLAKGAGLPLTVPFTAVNGFHYRARSQLHSRGLLEWAEKEHDKIGGLGAWPPEVVIVETLRQVMLGSENDSGSVADFWENLAPLADGRSIIVSHHMTKPSDVDEVRQQAKYRARGSGRMIDHPDSALACIRPNRAVEVVQVEHVKSREGKEHPTWGAALVHPAGDRGPALIQRADEEACRVLGHAPAATWRSGRAPLAYAPPHLTERIE